MDALLTEVKPMRIPRPKFCCSKPSLVYPVEPPKDYLDLDLENEISPAKVLEGHRIKSQKTNGIATTTTTTTTSNVEELGRALQDKVKV